MSDTGTSDLAGAIADAAPAAPADAGTDWKSRYDQEVADRIRERNLYKPYRGLVDGLDPDAIEAIQSLANAVRAGDADAIVQWNLDTAQNITGKDVATIIAERQAAAHAADVAPSEPGLSKDDVTRMVQEQMRLNATETQVRGELSTAGFPLDTPAGQTIIRYCVVNQCEPAKGIEWYKADLTERAKTWGGSVADAAAGTVLPGTAPTGAAASGAPAGNMSSRERAIARLKGVGGS